jgi:hypothetical protein
MKSFAILRTNAGLTTNVKVVVESDYSLSLDSIDSTPELSTTKLKKMVFNKNNYFDELVPYFFKGFPVDTAFAIKYENDSESMTDNFASQYDEIYQYGARNIVSNKDYKEEFEYFAPLHISKGQLPKYFIIFRVDGPGMIKLDRHNIKDEIFNNFKTVKLFDMTKKTNLGEWIDRNFISNQYFPTTAVEIDFDSMEFSQWNGIDYDSGGYTAKSLFLNDYLEKEKEIFEFEKFVLDGFKNNKVIYPNIINFSFLFDDTPATENSLRKWSINRYYGFYLEEMDLVKTMSPYRTPFIKSDAVIKTGNILESPTGDPFVEGWSDDRPFYVEYLGEYYKVERFVEKSAKPSLKPVVNKNQNPNQAPRVTTMKIRSKEMPIATRATLEDFDGNPPLTSGIVIKQEITPTYITKWRIISSISLTGKQALLNANIGYIDSTTKALMNYDNTNFDILDFELADLWVIEIDGIHHNLVKEDGLIKIHSDYAFKFYQNEYEYWINKVDTSYTKKVSFIVDSENPPKKFKIYRLSLSDIKDFDDKIVDTEYSKFEYEKETEITNTEETKLYMNNLNSTTHPKELDDFNYKNKVVHIPVSSEYTANHETFKIVGDDISPIWRKNSVHCRWAFENSLGANDYPYALNNSIRFEDYNRSVNPFDPDPVRSERNLDYFYTVNSSTFSYLHHTLHVENNGENGLTRFYFDLEKYLGIDTYHLGTVSKKYQFDYFSWFFDRKTTFLSNQIHKNAKKYSLFSVGDSTVPNITLFKGIKFLLHEVDSIKKNTNGQIEAINTKTSNKFENYKFSILLSHRSNGMYWDVIDEWKMDKDYRKADIVVYNDILYRAKRNSKTTMPTVNKNSLQIKALPYNLTEDWEYYVDPDMIMFNPLNSQNNYYIKGSETLSKAVVYNSGDYYMFNGYDKPIDFWNPIIAYKTNSRLLRDTDGRVSHMGYSMGSIVLYRGDYYKSTLDNNIYPPNYTQEFLNSGNLWQRYWQKIEPVPANSTRWIEIQIWNPSATYAQKTYIVHNEILYISNILATTISSGEEPGISNLWDRLYSLVEDTTFNYQPNKNPLIRMNNEYYQIMSNPWSSTLENGINIYINEKWKHVFVNIVVNDNTLANLSNKNRDDLYISLNKKLTAMNFISAINNLSNKHDFTDYINYKVIDTNGVLKNYNFENIESLPYIMFAEKPERIDIKVNSLQIKQIKVSGIKATKVLPDGNIDNLTELNYFNNTHIATSIETNQENPVVRKNYHGGQNIINDTVFRFGGNYVPLFYDIELFKRDNATSYNEMQIALNLESTQDLVFKFEKSGTSVEKIYTVYSGASYSYNSNTLFTAQNNPAVKPTSPSASTIRELGTVVSRINTPVNIAVQSTVTPYDWSAGAKEGERYLVGTVPTGAWAGTYSVAGTSSVFTKKNSIAHVVRGMVGPSGDFIVASGTSSIPGWTNAMGGISGTWSYTPPEVNDVVYVRDLDANIRYDGKNWISHIISSTGVFKNVSSFVGAGFYNQIKNIILNESIFKGIDFIFEAHPIDSLYVDDKIYKDFRAYDKRQSDNGLMRNYNILSIKYKSTYGDLKVEISRIKPTLSVVIDDFSTSNSDLGITLGATGLNPPFQWSFTYSTAISYDPDSTSVQAFTTSNTYLVPDISGTNLVFDIKVMDSVGLTSSVGYYSRNNNSPIVIDGTFSYTTL